MLATLTDPTSAGGTGTTWPAHFAGTSNQGLARSLRIEPGVDVTQKTKAA